MIEYLKPGGSSVQINENPANLAKADKLGWIVASATATPEPPTLDAKGLPWDERINTKNKAQNDQGHWKYKQGVNAQTAAPVEQELYAALVDG